MDRTLLEHILENGDPSWKTQGKENSDEKARDLTGAT